MKLKTFYTLAFSVFFVCLCAPAELAAQCDTTAQYADRYMSDRFVPDGQSYRALIFDEQIAEFHTTFYGGSRYRIIAFSGLEKEQLVFSLFDEKDNLMFTNEEHHNTPYWDFEIESTLSVRIEARLDLLKQTSGCAVLLIGFER
ncbi:MAG: hypothetical protein ABR572_03120 [Cryomorphaceae bacterium]|nr:hypothetical protein [Flavobacteriales bacterium]